MFSKGLYTTADMEDSVQCRNHLKERLNPRLVLKYRCVRARTAQVHWTKMKLGVLVHL